MPSPLREIEELLATLRPAEKAQVLDWLLRDLANHIIPDKGIEPYLRFLYIRDPFPGIESTPGVVGGAARIVRTRIPVWLLVHSRRLGMSDADLLRSYPSLRAEDLVNAWAYARTHPDEIEQQIIQNETA